jgi:carbamate kinase
VESTGHKAMIGRLDEAAELLAGNVGTLVEPDTIGSARGER